MHSWCNLPTLLWYWAHCDVLQWHLVVRQCNGYIYLTTSLLVVLYLTCLWVVHPVEDNLWCSVPAGHNITRHLWICLTCKSKVQDLHTNVTVFYICQDSWCRYSFKLCYRPSCFNTFNSQSWFTARFPGLRSWRTTTKVDINTTNTYISNVVKMLLLIIYSLFLKKQKCMPP